MKKILSLLLTLCLLFSVLPAQALAAVGDIRPAENNAVKQTTLSSGSLALQNDYIRVIARKDGTLSTAPATESADPTDRQTPYCYFVTYGSRHTTHPASLRLKSLTFVNKTPNGTAKAIRADYDLTVNLTKLTVSGTTSVYHELVQLKENESSEESWGVMVSVDNIRLNVQDSGAFFQTMNTDVDVYWGYTLSGFTAMGHPKAADSPALKMGRTVYNYDKQTVLSTESSVITGKLENVFAYTGFRQGYDWCYDYITEVYTDGYNWANPFVGLSAYYSHNKSNTIKVYLPDTVSVTPASRPANTRVVCEDSLGLVFGNDESYPSSSRFLWGFRNLVVKSSEVPTEPDKVDPTIYAQRLAVFARRDGVMVLPVASDAALSALKLIYGDPISFINGNYESKNGTEFTFTGGAALLSPSVTATWGSGGSLVIHWDGRVEQRGVHLSAPSFKFYQPKSGAESNLKIKLTNKGFSFDIDPTKNEAIVFVDIPYATVKLESATTNGAGDLILGGGIGFKTVLEGAQFNMEKLGFGLNEKKEFKVNGVKATGSFDTAKLMALELAKVEGEVNTFKGEERYAFELELNAFDLFETEAKLALERSKKDGSLIPDELWFYVKANPGIPLIPPVPIGQLNGGGAGFKDLAATVNGDYFAIPPLKLRGALTGTYLHLIEGTGDVVLGPSEISLTAKDVGIVGLGKSGNIIEEFGYSLKLNGQVRNYKGTDYKGFYLVGSKFLKLNLPNNSINALVLGSSIDVGAFGGVTAAKDRLYLGVGANAIVKGRVQVPDDIRVIGGIGVDVGNINLIIGGQTTAPIRGVSVSDGMKQAFKNMDVYLGAMVGVNIRLVDTRVWVLIPQIVQTNFKRGEGWDFEIRFLGSLPEWNWADKGIEPIVRSFALQSAASSSVESSAYSVSLSAAPAALPSALQSAASVSAYSVSLSAAPTALPYTKDFTVTAGPDETPYIVLAFNNNVTEEQIKDALTIKKDGSDIGIYWLKKDGKMDATADINAMTIADMKKSQDDGEEYRLAVLRLKEGGTYTVNSGALEFTDEKSFAVEPFEKLELTQNGHTLSGQVKYPVENTTYVLRTYLGSAEGEATYLVDEQEVKDLNNISVNIPQSGALAPTGKYYVTSFLMTDKTFNMEGGTKQTELMGIDTNVFTECVDYTNTNQPEAPAGVTLEFVGNEVMRGEWQAVNDADGYRVTVYQEKNGSWVNTGFGYDLDKSVTALDMALTVGGAETAESKNLSANETYRIGVSAYRTVEGGKYYSAETQSAGKYLPKYTPLNMTLSVNGMPLTADENGVYHAYAGGEQSSMLAVSCDDAAAGVTYRVTRMDTGDEISQNSFEEYAIPDFTGTLMLKIDGKKGNDVTSVFLLVSMDKTPPVLTLSDPIFYADKDTGAYSITGTADAGSLINYGTDSIYAGSDGSFSISGTLDEGKNNGVLALYAQDTAGNESARQRALVVRRGTQYTVTIADDGNGTATATPTAAEEGMEVALSAEPKTGYHFKEWQVVSGSVTIVNNKFIMPSGNVEIKAIFEEDAPADPAKPVISVTGIYTYNGAEHTAAVTGYDPATMDISCNTASNAGDYTVSVTSKTGKWADGSADAVTAAWSIGKTTQEAPAELIINGVAPSTEGGSDGKIIGVTDKMEYRMASESSYTACSGTEIENLPAGTYFVRYAKDNNHFASSDTVVTVGAGAPLEDRTITFHGNGGSGSMRPVTVKTGTNYILPACGFTAPADQEFKAWEIGGTEYEVGACYTVNEETEVKALWKNGVITPTTYTVTVSNDGNGIGAASPSTAAAGTEITLTAAPNAGCHFKEWQVISPAGLVITNNKFTMPDGNVEVKAIFEKDAPTEYTVTFDGNGGTPSVGSMTTTDGKLASLPSASRRGSYSFDGWYTEKSGGTEVTTATVFSANTTVYAHWTYTGNGYNYYTIKATAGAGGSISPYGNVSVREGRDQTFTITPNKGYAVSNVKIDGKSIGAVKSYTFENVNRTHSIEVIFVKGTASARTGDSSNLPLWSALLLASALTLAGAVHHKRKRAR